MAMIQSWSLFERCEEVVFTQKGGILMIAIGCVQCQDVLSQSWLLRVPGPFRLRRIASSFSQHHHIIRIAFDIHTNTGIYHLVFSMGTRIGRKCVELTLDISQPAGIQELHPMHIARRRSNQNLYQAPTMPATGISIPVV